MEIVQRASGIEVAVPPDYILESADVGTSSIRRSGRPARHRRIFVEDRMLIDALRTNEDIEVVDELVLEPRKQPAGASGKRGHRAPKIESKQNIQVNLDLNEGEEGVILLEQDGVYIWIYPDARERTHRRGARASRERSAVFNVDVYAESTQRRRGSRRGFVKNIIYKKVKAFVLKFVAKKATGRITKFLERKVRPGLLAMPSANPKSWKRFDGTPPSSLFTPNTSGATRLLLMVHGTFSSTFSGFGALGASPWGVEFVRAAHEQYDGVIGFDHPTLSVAPDSNADELYGRLRQLVDGGELELDVITHSRGGLVFRSLVEQVLPGMMWRPEVGRAVFVGVPNAGTTLAEPQNWHTFVDLYTNLAVAMCKALSLFPQATFVAKVLQESIETLSELVKYMATEAVTRRQIPGLSAMQPGGSYIHKLNQIQAGQPCPGNSTYYSIKSTFDLDLLEGLDEGDVPVLKQLPRHLIMLAIDNIASRLLGRECDLVVNTDSMNQIDSEDGVFIKETYDFGVNPHVYHTVYFTRPEVVSSLGQWLGLRLNGSDWGRRGARKTGQVIPSLEDLVGLNF